MDRQRFISRRAASRLLGVTSQTLAKIARANSITTHKLPGHSREYLDKQAVQRLADQFKVGQAS